MIKKYICLILIHPSLTAIEIRKPRAHEINDIATVYHQSWHNTFAQLSPHLVSVRTQEHCVQKWLQYYAKKNGHFIFVAIINKKIVGVVFAGPLENKDQKICLNYDAEVDKLYVSPACKNQGIGSQLLKAAFAQLRMQNFNKVLVRSLTKNQDTNTFYEKRGGTLVAQPTVGPEKMNFYEFKLN